MTELLELDNDKFESLVKIISIFEKSSSVNIKNSTIRQQFNTAILSCNLVDLLGEDIDLTILNPKKYIKLFKSFIKKNKKIKIYEEYEKYIISNGDIDIFCPKQIDKILNSNHHIKNNFTGIGDSIQLDKDERKSIKQLCSDFDFFDVLVHKDKIKAISVPETALYKLVDEDINEKNCDLKLRVYSILEIDGDSYNISLGKDDSNGYWIISIIDTGYTKIEILENATIRNNSENLLI